MTPESHKSAIDKAIEGITKQGFVIVDHIIDPSTTLKLAQEAKDLSFQGKMKKSSIGAGNKVTSLIKETEIRGDFTYWLDYDHLTDAQNTYINLMNKLRHGINESLFLGLFEFESHFAVYPPGTWYKRHLDQIKNQSERQISSIFYLNPQWNHKDGGALRLFINDDDFIDIMPEAGRLVLFLSDLFHHEVLQTNRERISLTGWFRRRSDSPI